MRKKTLVIAIAFTILSTAACGKVANSDQTAPEPVTTVAQDTSEATTVAPETTATETTAAEITVAETTVEETTVAETTTKYTYKYPADVLSPEEFFKSVVEKVKNADPDSSPTEHYKVCYIWAQLYAEVCNTYVYYGYEYPARSEMISYIAQELSIDAEYVEYCIMGYELEREEYMSEEGYWDSLNYGTDFYTEFNAHYNELKNKFEN